LFLSEKERGEGPNVKERLPGLRRRDQDDPCPPGRLAIGSLFTLRSKKKQREGSFSHKRRAGEPPAGRAFAQKKKKGQCARKKKKKKRLYLGHSNRKAPEEEIAGQPRSRGETRLLSEKKRGLVLGLNERPASGVRT